MAAGSLKSSRNTKFVADGAAALSAILATPAGAAALAAAVRATPVLMPWGPTGDALLDLQTMLARFVPVTRFGAKCDLSTDDTAALNEAAQSAMTYGHDIFVPGPCRVTNTWSIGNGIVQPLADSLIRSTANVSSTVQTNTKGLHRPIITFGTGAGVWGDFNPGGTEKAIIDYQLWSHQDNPGIQQGAIVGGWIAGQDAFSGGSLAVISPTATLTTKKQVGIHMLKGCRRVTGTTVRELDYGIVGISDYNCKVEAAYAWRCASIAFMLSEFNTGYFDGQAWYSTLGLDTYGAAARWAFLSQNNVQDIALHKTVIQASECSVLGPCYIEDGQSTDGTGKYALLLGDNINGSDILNVNLDRVRVGALRPNKKAANLKGCRGIKLDNSRFYGGAIDTDTVSYGTCVEGDMAAQLGTTWTIIGQKNSFVQVKYPNADQAIVRMDCKNVTGCNFGSSIAAGAKSGTLSITMNGVTGTSYAGFAIASGANAGVIFNSRGTGTNIVAFEAYNAATGSAQDLSNVSGVVFASKSG